MRVDVVIFRIILENYISKNIIKDSVLKKNNNYKILEIKWLNNRKKIIKPKIIMQKKSWEEN